MRRRDFLAAAGAGSAFAEAPPVVPVYVVTDTRAKFGRGVRDQFLMEIWGAAVKQFGAIGIRLEADFGEGEVGRAPSSLPVFKGLRHGVVNLVLTDAIPMQWDLGRGLAGVSVLLDGVHLCVIAVPRAHGNQIPLLSLNTCVHELLHVLLQDIYEARPKGLEGSGREARIDWYATRMWLFHDGAEVRRATAAYLARTSKK